MVTKISSTVYWISSQYEICICLFYNKVALLAEFKTLFSLYGLPLVTVMCSCRKYPQPPPGGQRKFGREAGMSKRRQLQRESGDAYCEIVKSWHLNVYFVTFHVIRYLVSGHLCNAYVTRTEPFSASLSLLYDRHVVLMLSEIYM